MANAFLIFQCPGICPTPSLVDILGSDDSPALSPTTCMYNRIFTLGETRAISELRVGLVPFNMLKRPRISFTVCSKAVQPLSIVLLNLYIMSCMFVFLMLSSDINVKTWPLLCTVGLVCLGGGEGAIKAFKPSKPLPWPHCCLQYLVSVGGWGWAVVANAFHSYNACWNMRALNNNGNEHRR